MLFQLFVFCENKVISDKPYLYNNQDANNP